MKKPHLSYKNKNKNWKFTKYLRDNININLRTFYCKKG